MWFLLLWFCSISWNLVWWCLQHVFLLVILLCLFGVFSAPRWNKRTFPLVCEEEHCDLRISQINPLLINFLFFMSSHHSNTNLTKTGFIHASVWILMFFKYSAKNTIGNFMEIVYFKIYFLFLLWLSFTVF